MKLYIANLFKPMKKYITNKAIVYDATGINLLCNRQLKTIIATKNPEQFLEQEVVICDREKIYGIIVLNKPHILDVDLFKNHSNRHFITNEFRENVWPNINKFYSFSFRIKKIFKEPLDYIYKGQEKIGMSEFIENIEVLQKGVIGYKDLGKAPIETAWNGPEERRKADVKVLKTICAWYNSEKPDVKSSYKLPHHKAEGKHVAVWNGVKAAMGALLGARGGTRIPAADKQGVYNHLKKHYGQFDKEAPTFKSYSVTELKSIFPELYQDIIKYEEKLEIFKNLECDEDKKELKNLFIELYKLFIKKLEKKAPYKSINKIEEVDEDGILKQIKVVIEGNFVRARMRSPSSIVKDSFRTITLSKSKGIKAIIGKLKSDPNGPTHVQAVLFEKDKWTIKRAREWVKSHKDSLKSLDYEELINA